IGVGAVIGSIFPWLLDKEGASNVATAGIPDTVKYSFWFGGAALFLAVLWTVISTREYSPEEMASFGEADDQAAEAQTISALANRSFGTSVVWIAVGLSVIFSVIQWGLEKEVYLLGGLLIAYGLANAAGIALARRGQTSNMLANIVGDFSGMPPIMKRLALAQ